MSIVEKITPYWIQTISFLAQWTAAVIDDRPDLVILLAIVAIILVLVIAAIKIIRRYLTPPPTPGKTPGSFIAGRDLEAMENLQQLADAENATSNRISVFGEALYLP